MGRVHSWPESQYVLASDFRVYGDRDETDGLNSLTQRLRSYQTLLLNEGPIYYVRPGQFALPTKDATFGAPAIASVGAGNWHMEAIAGGDATAAVIQQDRWLTGAANGNFASTPWEIRDHFIECAGLCKFGIVLKSYAPKVRWGVVQGATDTGILFTRQNQDGSLGAPTFLSGAVVEGNGLYNNTKYGIRTQGQADNLSQAPTDGRLSDNTCAGSEVGMHLDNCGGWKIFANDVFTCSIAAAEFDNLARHHDIHSNIFDSAPVVVGGMGGYVGKLHKNKISSLLRVNFAGAGAETFISEMNSFFRLEGTGTHAYIEHNNNSASKLLISRKDDFSSTNSHQMGAGNTLGIFRIEGGVNGNGLLPEDGLVLPVYATTRPSAPPAGLRLYASRSF